MKMQYQLVLFNRQIINVYVLKNQLISVMVGLETGQLSTIEFVNF